MTTNTGAREAAAVGTVVLLLAGFLVGCTDDRAPRGDAAAAGPASRDALPSGHPPPEAAGDLRLAWEVPRDWIVEQPDSRMRVGQYRVPGAAGDGRCVVFYFGPGEGGDPSANARRWAGQFEQPDGSSSLDRMQVTLLDSTAIPVRIVELTGTYDGGMARNDEPARSQPGFMLLGAIAEGPGAPWFFKLTGPEATVRPQREAFVRMLESIRLED